MSRGPHTKLDQPTFRELFRAHAGFVWRVLRRYGVSSDELEDACQEVFLVVHRRFQEFTGRASVRTWIYEIARRTALAHVRRTRRREPLAPPELDIAADYESPEQQVTGERARVWLSWALAQLDEDKREAFVLYELEQLTLAEAAAALHCAINTIHYRVLTARKELVRLSRRRSATDVPKHPLQLRVRKEMP